MMKTLIRELPPGCSATDIEEAYSQGLLRKTELHHGYYYRGTCRNAEVARWHAGAQRFMYMHRDCGFWLSDAIPHVEDETRYDVFLAVEQTTPTAQQAVPDAEFEQLGR